MRAIERHKRKLLFAGTFSFVATCFLFPSSKDGAIATSSSSNLSSTSSSSLPSPSGETIKPPQPGSVDIFAGGSRSIAALAIGYAEGTLELDGSPTRAYRGHKDPGNAEENLGLFSWQAGGCNTPEECDQLGLKRLSSFYDRLSTMPGGAEVLSNLEAVLSYLDLSIQAPLAAADFPALYKKHRDVFTARFEAFRDPATGKLDTTLTGVGIATLEEDQKRRIDAIRRSIEAPGD